MTGILGGAQHRDRSLAASGSAAFTSAMARMNITLRSVGSALFKASVIWPNCSARYARPAAASFGRLSAGELEKAVSSISIKRKFLSDGWVTSAGNWIETPFMANDVNAC